MDCPRPAHFLSARRGVFEEELTGGEKPSYFHFRLKTPQAKSNERVWVWSLCVIAAIRVFVYAAAFPFFNNVDEMAHFDLVIKYSHGQVPRGLDTMSPESAHYLALFGSPEYFMRPQQFGIGQIPKPLWQRSGESAKADYERGLNRWQNEVNHEATGAPLYYMVAGAWLRLGRLAGLTEFSQLYWIRFLNAFVVVALVWLGFVAARLIFPERRWLWLGVPLLLAFFPQDTFYSIESDVLSPVCFGAAFICLVKWLRAEAPNVKLGLATGSALAATYLTKTSNLPLLVVAVVALALHVEHLARTKNLRAALPALAMLGLSAGLPIGGWMAWCQIHYGDLTGSAAKIQFFFWTRKSFGEWWSHPIFTLHGAWIFWSDLMASFWRGEFVWSLQRLAWPAMDGFYWISSALFVGLAVAGLLQKTANASPAQRQALCLGFWCFLSMVIFLVILSIAFNFGRFSYPSAKYPYFTSGRLLTGALIPFALFYTYGLDRALCWIKGERPRLLVLLGIVLTITVSEIFINSVAFLSEYNWFHS
jgi:hypothetical protein